MRDRRKLRRSNCPLCSPGSAAGIGVRKRVGKWLTHMVSTVAHFLIHSSPLSLSWISLSTSFFAITTVFHWQNWVGKNLMASWLVGFQSSCLLYSYNLSLHEWKNHSLATLLESLGHELDENIPLQHMLLAVPGSGAWRPFLSDTSLLP